MGVLCHCNCVVLQPCCAVRYVHAGRWACTAVCCCTTGMLLCSGVVCGVCCTSLLCAVLHLAVLCVLCSNEQLRCVFFSIMFGSRCGRVNAISIIHCVTMLCYVCVFFQCAQLCCVNCWSAAPGGSHCCALLCRTVLRFALQCIGIERSEWKTNPTEKIKLTGQR